MPQKKKNNFKTFYAVSLAFQLGFIIIIPITAFLMIGILADRFFHTTPLLIITGIITGFIITVYEVHHILKIIVKH